MAIPNETLELTNSQHMPPVILLTGNELIPAANNVTDKLPVSLTPSDMGEYVHGQYTFQLTDYADTPTSLSTLLMVENGQTYKISINDVVNFAQANLTLTGTGLVTVTATGPSS